MRAIAQNLQNQIPRLIEPALNIPQARLMDSKVIEVRAQETQDGEGPQKSKSRRAARRVRPGINDAKSPALNWPHDPGKWGVPRQSWTAANKMLWLMRVATAELNLKEISGPAIAETFNTHFRQAGPLEKRSVVRDLGRLKQHGPALVSDDASKSPTEWFLTEEGTKEADKLVLEAKGPASA